MSLISEHPFLFILFLLCASCFFFGAGNVGHFIHLVVHQMFVGAVAFFHGLLTTR